MYVLVTWVPRRRWPGCPRAPRCSIAPCASPGSGWKHGQHHKQHTMQRPPQNSSSGSNSSSSSSSRWGGISGMLTSLSAPSLASWCSALVQPPRPLMYRSTVSSPHALAMLEGRGRQQTGPRGCLNRLLMYTSGACCSPEGVPLPQADLPHHDEHVLAGSEAVTMAVSR